LSVNVSAKQFYQINFSDTVKKAIYKSGIDPRQLKLEITESILVSDISTTITVMNELAKLGVRFSMDDFGTGYSSLQYLKQLPLSQLKIDQSFVRDLASDESDLVIIRTIIAMAKSLGL
jgi:EAL domain-containing protein (putative c-di-GMP-specific phosphodiesterase class I)